MIFLCSSETVLTECFLFFFLLFLSIYFKKLEYMLLDKPKFEKYMKESCFDLHFLSLINFVRYMNDENRLTRSKLSIQHART